MSDSVIQGHGKAQVTEERECLQAGDNKENKEGKESSISKNQAIP